MGSSPSPTASTATCVPATRAGSRPSSWKPGGAATPDALADGAERTAPLRRPAPPVARTRATFDLLGAQVGQPDAAVGVAHPAVALRGAPLRYLALAWAPTARSKRERRHEHEQNGRPHEQHRAHRRDPQHNHDQVIPTKPVPNTSVPRNARVRRP